MAVDVYAWPPVGITEWQITPDRPVAASRSLLTGREYLSAAGRKRHLIKLAVSALARGRNGAGYMAALGELLDGNANLVRIPNMPVNWWLDRAQINASGWPDTVSGAPVLRLTGLPASKVAGRPMDPILLTAPSAPSSWEVVHPLQPIIADGSGAATVRLLAAATIGTSLAPAAVTLRPWTSRVYRLNTIPSAPQNLTGDWSFPISGREVFPEEVGGFVELNPWI